MTLLDQLEPSHRALLEEIATPVVLDRGAYLIRRGEAGGDFFVVDEGQIEIVDSRTTPETILAVLSAGATLGEVSFVDDAPRSADARARGPARVRRWAQQDVRGLLRREPALGASFYQCIARVTSGHLRNQTEATVAGRGRAEGHQGAGLDGVRADVSAFARALKASLVQAETALRQDPGSAEVRAAIERALDGVQSWVCDHFAAYPEPELALEAARLIMAELHPYLVRSALADLCIRRAHGSAGLPEVLTRVLDAEPTGDGELGVIVDRWLLDRPTFRALRASRSLLCAQADRALGDRDRVNLAVFNAGAGLLVRDLGAALGDRATTLTLCDPSREAIKLATAAMVGTAVTLTPVQVNVIDIAVGRWRAELPSQDAIVVHDLVDYLPDRLVLGFVQQIVALLGSGGTLLLSALAPSADGPLLDRIFGWPSVRRQPDRLVRLLGRAGLQSEVVVDGETPLVIVIARRGAGEGR